MVQSWDLAFKDLETSDYVVGQVWGSRKADRFLLHQTRARLDLPGTKAAIKEMAARYARTGAILVEDKANGPAVIQELRHDLAGLIEVNPEGGKLARVHAVSPEIEAGNVYLPHPSIAPWVMDFLEEASRFPNGRHDDQVDAMTQALNRLRNADRGLFVPESRLIVNPFEIPNHWPRAFAMAITRKGVAALWGAREPGGQIYLYNEHLHPHSEPSSNARAIRDRGDWIPGVINFSEIKASKAERNTISQMYSDHGLRIEYGHSSDEAGAMELWYLQSSNRLKVFTNLALFLSEYRIGEEQSPLMLCCHALLLNQQCMRTRPVKQIRRYQEPLGGTSMSC